MARQRQLLVNIERMRHEVDEFFGDTWQRQRSGGKPSGFIPRVDVYYCKSDEPDPSPIAIVKADLAGVDPDGVALEISPSELVLAGERPIRDTAGRVYQQVEIPTGRFRRVIELGVEVIPERAQATFEDGMLRIELPVKSASQGARRVPIERAD